MCSLCCEVDGNLQGEAMGLGENGRRVARLVEEVKRGGEEMGGDRRKAMFKAFTASGEDFFTHSPFRPPSRPWLSLLLLHHLPAFTTLFQTV